MLGTRVNLKVHVRSQTILFRCLGLAKHYESTNVNTLSRLRTGLCFQILPSVIRVPILVLLLDLVPDFIRFGNTVAKTYCNFHAAMSHWRIQRFLEFLHM